MYKCGSTAKIYRRRLSDGQVAHTIQVFLVVRHPTQLFERVHLRILVALAFESRRVESGRHPVASAGSCDSHSEILDGFFRLSFQVAKTLQRKKQPGFTFVLSFFILRCSLRFARWLCNIQFQVSSS